MEVYFHPNNYIEASIALCFDFKHCFRTRKETPPVVQFASFSQLSKQTYGKLQNWP